MIHLSASLSPEQLDKIEELSCEWEISQWMLYDDREAGTCRLNGYFDTEEAALEAYTALRKQVDELPEDPMIIPLEEKDWKEAYKEHFHPWSHMGLHWVPLWEKDKYNVPLGEAALYLDPGMAFGTGNHETTRLCALRLVETAGLWKDSLNDKSVIDAGCGSGILSLSAAKLGFKDILGFDIDPDSVEVAKDNASANGLQNNVVLECKDLTEGLDNKQADIVLANILAPTLIEYSEQLLGAVKTGGCLVLSVIMAEEIESVVEVYKTKAEQIHGEYTLDCSVDGQWSDLVFRFY